MKRFFTLSLLLGTWSYSVTSGPTHEATGIRQGRPSADSAALADLRKMLIPLTSVHAGTPSADLTAFGEAIKDARLVSLGEASHGSREVFQMKHRLFEYLVREKGFTVFAIEGNWPETEALDRYIKTGEGDPRAGLRALHAWPWQADDVLALVEWMRAFNQAPGDHPILTFTGFDMQRHRVALEQTLAAVRGTRDAAAVGAAYSTLRALKDEPWNDPALEESADRADSVLRLLEQHQAAARTIRMARVVAQAIRNRTGAIRSYRDQMMASNVRWLLDQGYPSAKIVLWAHNAHVSMAHEPQFAGGRGTRWMGNWLHESLGAQMYVLGFAIDSGTVRARRVDSGKLTEPLSNPLPPSPPGTGTAMLTRAGVPMFFLEMKGASGRLGLWLEDEHLFREIGAGWTGDQPPMIPRRLSRSFDGLIFLAHTSASHSF